MTSNSHTQDPCLFQPFLDADHWIQPLFPPREWALIIPSAAGILGVIAIGILYQYLNQSITPIAALFYLSVTSKSKKKSS